MCVQYTQLRFNLTKLMTVVNVEWHVGVSVLEHPWVRVCSYYKDMMTDS